MEFENPDIVYVQSDDSGYITAVDSSAFLTDTTGWTEIDSGFGDKYYHAQGNYFPDSVTTEDGVFRYKMLNGKAVLCTAKELETQKKIVNSGKKPTLEARLEALENSHSEIKTVIASMFNKSAS